MRPLVLAAALTLTALPAMAQSVACDGRLSAGAVQMRTGASSNIEGPRNQPSVREYTVDLRNLSGQQMLVFVLLRSTGLPSPQPAREVEIPSGQTRNVVVLRTGLDAPNYTNAVTSGLSYSCR